MKKYYFYAGLLSLSLGLTACGDDDDPTPNPNEKPGVQIPEGTADVTIEDNNLDVTASNVEAWGRYSAAVATLLAKDAAELSDAWLNDYVKDGVSTGAFAETFKHPSPNQTYKSYNDCIEQIIDGCIDIASEVGSSKIGEPRDLWEKGKYTEAVYAVESWYSFHSIDDYANNIQSIRNAFNGTRDNTEATYSIASYLKKNNAALYASTRTAINTAYTAIKSGMKAPFRSYIGHASVLAATEACAALGEVLDNEVKGYFSRVDDDKALADIVNTYVDGVVVPTYNDLKQRTAELNLAVKALQAQPATSTFKAAANAWMKAREPWESSEAFLFGPVDELGLDPNMDSWPLDVDAIKEVLVSGDFSKMEWTDDQEDEDIEAAQNVRGFHTLEFLLFKNGEARTY